MENKLSILSLVINIILAGFVGFLYFDMRGLASQVVALESGKTQALVNPAAAGKDLPKNFRNTESLDIVVNDEGFSPSGFKIGQKDAAVIVIANQGEAPHSFVIKSLGIDSGAIAPGQAATVSLDKKFDQPAALEFGSGVEGDSPEKFKGTIMVF